MNVHFSATGTDRETPQDFFDELDREFGFQIDVCANESNAKCLVYLSERFDGLAQEWGGVCWMNPPYGREIGKWVAKAAIESRAGATVVALLPARTDTNWWHTFIWNYDTHAPYPGVEIRFIAGRLRFNGVKKDAPFPSVVVVFRPPTSACLTSASPTDV